MSDSSGIAVAGSTRWLRFHVADLMLLTVAVAIGFAARLEGSERQPWDWAYAALIGLTALGVIGFLRQAWDMGVAIRGHVDLTDRERRGFQFAILWRIAIAVLFLVQVAIGAKYDPQAPLADLPWALPILVLIVALSSVPRVARRWKLKRGLDAISRTLQLIVALSLAAVMWTEEMTLMALVHISTIGIMNGQPEFLARDYVQPDVEARGRLLLPVIVAGITLTMTALYLVSLWARRWDDRRIRIWLAVPVLATAAGAVSVAMWLVKIGLPAAAPFIASESTLGPWHVKYVVVTIALILVTSIAYLLAMRTGNEPNARSWQWRREGGYFHEKRWFSALILCLGVAIYCRFVANYRQFLIVDDDYLLYLYIQPPGLLVLALFFLALRGVFARRNLPNESQTVQPKPLGLSQFACVWMVTAVSMAAGIVVCVWLGFAIWLSPLPLVQWP